MNKIQNVHYFKDLYKLLIFYYENREQPVQEGFDFFAEVKLLCNHLNLDYQTFIEEMQLNKFPN